MHTALATQLCRPTCNTPIMLFHYKRIYPTSFPHSRVRYTRQTWGGKFSSRYLLQYLCNPYPNLYIRFGFWRSRRCRWRSSERRPLRHQSYLDGSELCSPITDGIPKWSFNWNRTKYVNLWIWITINSNISLTALGRDGERANQTMPIWAFLDTSVSQLLLP